MSDRIIKPNGEEASSKPAPPQNMNDLLDQAHNHWMFKRKDDAFVFLVAGVRLLSQGVAQIIKELEELKKKDE